MDVFQKQLSTFVGQLAAAIIQLDGDLNEHQHQIELCRARIASGKLLLRSDQVTGQFLAEKALEFQPYASLLSDTIRDVDEINEEFAEFESDVLNFKELKFAEIGQMIDDRTAAHRPAIDQLSPLLEEIGRRLKAYRTETGECSAKRDQVERSIPLLETELNERRQLCDDLDGQRAQLAARLCVQKRALDEKVRQRTNKETACQKSRQKQVALKQMVRTQNGKLTEVKCQIRQSIFEYVNKVQRLDSLTEAKNRKMNEFLSLFRKYNREGVARLNERRSSLKADLDRLCSDADSLDSSVIGLDWSKSRPSEEGKKDDNKSDSENRTEQNAGLRDEAFHLIKRLLIKRQDKKQTTLRNLITGLDRVDHLYDRLIGSDKAEIGEKVVDDDQTDQLVEQVPEQTGQAVTDRPTDRVVSSPTKADEQPAASLRSKLRSYKRKG